MRPADGLRGPPTLRDKLLNIQLRGEEREASELIVEVSHTLRISMLLNIQGPAWVTPGRWGGLEQGKVLPSAAVGEKTWGLETMISVPEVLDQSSRCLAALENDLDEIVRRWKNRH